ncbi:MAG: hypothetical protein M0R16_10290 [Bacteroidales bacterium]|jgi:hypothetical protein|nr:hypothetical protein [Bacteroidales bacterium]
MKTKFNFLAIVGIVLMLAFTACGSQDNKTTSTEQNSTNAKALYTCPMHPEVRSDKPGKCPKCGMDLVKVEKESDTAIVKN